MEEMSLSLEECIRSYDREMSRKSVLESKASALLSVNAIVISLLIGLFTLVLSEFIVFDYNPIIIDINLISLYLVFVSIYYSLKALKIKYQNVLPFKVTDSNSLKKELQIDQKLLENELFKRYVNAIPQIHSFNNDKSDFIIKSSRYLISGLVLSFVSIILIVFVKGFINA